MVDRIGQRGDDLDRLLVGRLALAEPVLEGDPRHEVGDDETSAVLNPDVVNGDDSRVFEPGQPSRFQEENLPVLRSQGPERDLDGDLPLEQVVPADMDPAEPAPTQLAADQITTERPGHRRFDRFERRHVDGQGLKLQGLGLDSRRLHEAHRPRKVLAFVLASRIGPVVACGVPLGRSSAGNAERPLVPGGRAAGERHTLRPPCFRFLVRHGHRRSLEEGRCSSRVNERN